MTENIFPYDLPENWQWTTLGKICEIVNGYAFKSEKFSSDGIPVVRIADIKNGAVDLSHCVYTSEKNIDDKFIVKRGDLLIALSGATTGKNGICISDKKIFFNQRVGNIKIKNYSSLIEGYRNFYILFIEQKILQNSYGGAQPNISGEKIKKFPIPLPPIDEQKKIVEHIESLFSKLDSAQNRLKAVLCALELQRVQFIRKAFEGTLTAKFRAMNGFSKDDWQEKTLGEVCKINPPKISTANLSDDLKVSFFPMSSLSETEGKITNPQIKFLGEVKSGYTNFSEGDVVFAKITPCMENGKSAVIEKLVNDIGYGTTEFFVLRCNKEIFNRFLYHLVRSKKFRTEAKEVMAGAVGQQRVPKKFLSEYKISLPSLAEQKEIVRVLNSLLDKEQRTKELAGKILQEIDLLKKSVLARAFRGEL